MRTGFRERDKHLFLAINERGRVVACEFEAVTVSDRVSGTCFYAIAAKDAAVVIDVVDFRVPLGSADAALFGVLRRFNVDTVCRTRGGAEETGHALFQAVFIALQNMCAAIALLYLCRAVRVFFRNSGLQHLL